MTVSVSSDCAKEASIEAEGKRRVRPEKVTALVLKKDVIETAPEEFNELSMVLITDGFCRGRLIGELSDKDLAGAYYSGCIRRAGTRGKIDCFTKLKRFVEHFHEVYRESNPQPVPVVLSPEVVPSGKHKGKQLSELPDHVLMAMQGSWADSPRLRESGFFAKIQSEIRLRNLHVLETSPQVKLKQKTAKRSRATIELELKKLCGGFIPDDKRQLLQDLLSGI